MELRYEQDKNKKFIKSSKKLLKTGTENTFIESIDMTIEVVNSASTVRESLVPPISESVGNNEIEGAKNIIRSALVHKFLKKTSMKSSRSKEKSAISDSIDENSELEHSAKTKDTRRVSIAASGTESAKDSKRVTIAAPMLSDEKNELPLSSINESAKGNKRVTITAAPIVEENGEESERTATELEEALAKNRRVTIAVPANSDEIDETTENVALERAKSKSRKSIFELDLTGFSSATSDGKNYDLLDRQKSGRTNEMDIALLNQWYEIDTLNPSSYLLKPIRYILIKLPNCVLCLIQKYYLSSVLPDFNNKKDTSKRDAAKIQWNQARKILIKILEKYGQNTVNLTASKK